MLLELSQNPDILANLSTSKNRPKLVIGFAAETENLIENAQAKRRRKGCDWMIANQVGDEDDPVFGSTKVLFSQNTNPNPNPMSSCPI